MTQPTEGSQNPHVVVVGAGQIGSPLVDALCRDGRRVTWVSRRSTPPARQGVTHVQLDAADGPALAALCEGAAALIVAVGTEAYAAAAWARALPPLWRGVLEAARRSGTRLVLLDNLYMYALEAEPLAPTTPLSPATRKGAVRKQLAEDVAEAQRQGVRATTLRASDFWGPGLTSALVTEQTLRDLRDGKRPMLLGDPDVPHAFSHRDDVVEALVTLAFADDDVEGRVFHAPVLHATPRALLTAVAESLGAPAPAPRILPRWGLVLAGAFSATARGMIEMLPQWERPYRVDDRSFVQRFGRAATGLDVGAARLAGRAATA